MRWLVALAGGLLCLPVMVLAGLGLAIGATTVQQGSATFGILVLLQVLVALAATGATLRAVAVFVNRGAEGLQGLSHRTLGLMHAGALLVAAAGIALAVDQLFRLGALASFLMSGLAGAPALAAYGLVVGLRADGATRPGVRIGDGLGQGAVVVAGLMFAAVLALCPLPFRSAAWQADGTMAEALHLRQRTAWWLAGSGAFAGTERSRVIAMLGSPDQEGERHSVMYALGPNPADFFMSSMQWLVVDFDERDRVVEARVYSED